MLSAFKCSQRSTPFTEKALAFKDRVYKANTCPGKAKWNADEILGAVENIPGLVRGVAKEAGAQKLYDKAKRKSEKFTKAASEYINGEWAAGNDKNCDIVHNKGENAFPEQK